MATNTPPPVRLLIVDDDEALRQALARRFQRLGMAVAEAADAEEALAKAGHSAYDVAQEQKGNKVQAARILGISRRALYRLIAKYGLEVSP